jgi:hypothetical protein
MDHNVNAAARHFDAQESAAEDACARAATLHGLTAEQAETCDDGEHRCPTCPWRKDAHGVAPSPARLLVTVCEQRDGDGLTHLAMLHHEGQQPAEGMCLERRADRAEVEQEAADWREFLSGNAGVKTVEADDPAERLVLMVRKLRAAVRDDSRASSTAENFRAALAAEEDLIAAIRDALGVAPCGTPQPYKRALEAARPILSRLKHQQGDEEAARALALVSDALGVTVPGDQTVSQKTPME